METKYLEKSYRLADDRSGESLLLKVGKNRRLLVFDEAKGHNRAIRHCPNERSIFVDEQSEHALVEPIIFEFGYLDVNATDQITQKFLDIHPDNVSNGGTWFEPVDDEMEAKESIEMDEKIMDIKYAVRAKSKEEDGIHALMAVVAVLTGSVIEASQMGKEELKVEIYRAAERNPDYFVDDSGNVTIFNDDYIYRKYLVLKSIKDGIIKKSSNGKSMLWYRDNKMICTSPASIDLVDYFTDYLTTDDGMLVLEEIQRRS